MLPSIILFLALFILLSTILSVINKVVEYSKTSKSQSTVVEFISLIASAALFSLFYYLTH